MLVVRNNLERQMNGLSLNAEYNGETEAAIHTGIEELSNIRHKYNGVANGGLETGFMAGLAFKRFNIFGKKEILNIEKSKNLGPPYYKFPKKFSSSGSSSSSQPT